MNEGILPDKKIFMDEQAFTIREEDRFASIENADVSVWEIIGQWGAYIIVLLLPLWFLPLTISPVDTNKIFLVSILAIVGFIAWLGMAVYHGVLTIPRALPLYALGIWVIVYALASVFSVSPEVSFWGSSATSFFNIAIGALVTMMAAATLRTAKDTRRAHMLFLFAAAVAAVFMVIQTLLSIDIFQWEFAKARTFHPIGAWNAVGIFFGFVMVSLLPLVSGSDSSRVLRISAAALTALSLVLAATVNFRILWVGVAFVSIVYLAYQYSAIRQPAEREGTRNTQFVAWPMALILLSVLLYLSQSMISALTLNISPPLDVTPSVSSSLQIAREVMREDSLLGVGPNSFGSAWDTFKNPAVNTSIFWRLRFGTGSSFATTLPTTTGIVGAIAFLAFVGSVLAAGFSLMRKLRMQELDHRFLAGSLLGLLFLLFTWFIYPLTIITSILTFFMLGLMIAQMRAAGFITSATVPIRADSAKGFVTALVIIFLMVFGVVGLYVTSQKYVAAIIYGRGVRAFDERGSVNEAEILFRRAAEFDNSRDHYYRALAHMSSIKLQRSLANAEGQPPEEVRSAFQFALSGAIAGAQAATQANPGDAANWRILGQIYESVIPFVGGAADAAVEAYRAAIERSPRDPALRDDLARVHIALGDHVQAREALEEAIKLKPDYAAAHFRLAQIAAIKGNVADAISNTERAALAAPNDIGILFQLGLLYYQQERTREASQVLERAISLNPNYSNARYFLGLSYAARGERDLAIEQFRHIGSLNPDNAEVLLILANLEEGKDALAGITPPPLDRTRVPVAKETEELEQQDELQEESVSNENIDAAVE